MAKLDQGETAKSTTKSYFPQLLPKFNLWVRPWQKKQEQNPGDRSVSGVFEKCKE